MPSQPKSPYTTSFRSAIKRGTPAGVAVAAIAKRSGKNPNQVFSSLYKAELCDRQKLNGQWVYWPAEPIKRSATQAKQCQVQMWQSFVDWCLASGNCKPEQLERNTGSQSEFMSYCRKYFNRQITPGSGSSRSKKRSIRRPTVSARRSTPRSGSRSSSYKFPQAGRTPRRHRKAA